MDKEHFRFYIKVRTALDIQPIVIHNELCTVFGHEAPPLRTVQRWSKWFREGREAVEDEERPGRPIMETTPGNIEQIRDLINDDPYATIDELEAQSGLSHGTVQRSRFAPKSLLSIFFKSTSPVLIHSVERGQTIDHQYYIDNCLQPVIDEIKSQRPSLGIRAINFIMIMENRISINM